ncbi:hypothetical protein IPM65_06935 [Candidatus Roizmanbacteria bacterium]|nr:MAG: hypothetical protein IPM65_06935 [Candidatus Roizmanbacteria bacterium]
MKQETIVAIVFGILLGAGAGLFVLFQTNNSDEAKVIPIESDDKKVITQPVTASTSQAQLVVSSPEPGAVVNEDTVTISGKAPLNGLIVFQSQVAEEILKNEKGDFSVEMPLALGENVIQISVYSGSSTPQEQTLRIYYLKDE